MAHDWPGNVRELEHWMESAIVLSPTGIIAQSRLPRRSAAPESVRERVSEIPVGLSLDEAIRRYAEATICACDGNKAEAARRLKIGRNTIARILKPD